MPKDSDGNGNMGTGEKEQQEIVVSPNYCCLCGGHDKQVGPLVGRPNTPNVCVNCARTVVSTFEGDAVLLAEHRSRMRTTGAAHFQLEMPRPKDIFDKLSEHIIGQERAKRVLAIASADHYKGIMARALSKPVRMEKQNILLIGPTGVGKTALARALADTLNVPFAIGDATTITEAGYVGEDVENLLLKLIQAADGNIEDAQKGVLYIDEADKIGKKTGNVSITRDVSGEGVQQALLKLIEGTSANVPPQGGRKHPEQQCIRFDTTNVLFILGGTFEGGGGNGRIEEIVARTQNQQRMGFGAPVTFKNDSQERYDELRGQIEPEHLVEYGMIPELVGRLPVIAPLHALTVDHLTRILTEPIHSLAAQYQQNFEMSGVRLEFDDGAVRAIALKGYDKGTGARSLVAVMADLLEQIKFDIDDYKDRTIRITEAMATGEDEIKPVLDAKAA